MDSWTHRVSFQRAFLSRGWSFTLNHKIAAYLKAKKIIVIIIPTIIYGKNLTLILEAPFWIKIYINRDRELLSFHNISPQQDG